MKNDVSVRLAEIKDAASIAVMLAHLAEDLGDDAFLTTPEIIRDNGFDERRIFHCQIASIDEKDVGVALYFRNFSTTKGSPGVYVQDLWVDGTTRGAGVGQKLLAAVVKHANTDWAATYLKLTVHSHNQGAERFYTRLGFSPHIGEQQMTLSSADFTNLQATT